MCYGLTKPPFAHPTSKVVVKYTSPTLYDSLYQAVVTAAGARPAITMCHRNEHTLEFDLPSDKASEIMAAIRGAVPTAHVQYGNAASASYVNTNKVVHRPDPYLLVTTSEGKQVKVSCVWKDDMLKEVVWTRDHGLHTPFRVEPHEIEKIEIVIPPDPNVENKTETTAVAATIASSERPDVDEVLSEEMRQLAEAMAPSLAARGDVIHVEATVVPDKPAEKPDDDIISLDGQGYI